MALRETLSLDELERILPYSRPRTRVFGCRRVILNRLSFGKGCVDGQMLATPEENDVRTMTMRYDGTDHLLEVLEGGVGFGVRLLVWVGDDGLAVFVEREG